MAENDIVIWHSKDRNSEIMSESEHGPENTTELELPLQISVKGRTSQ